MVSLFTQRNLKASGTLALNWDNTIRNHDNLGDVHSSFDLILCLTTTKTGHKDQCEVKRHTVLLSKPLLF